MWYTEWLCTPWWRDELWFDELEPWEEDVEEPYEYVELTEPRDTRLWMCF